MYNTLCLYHYVRIVYGYNFGTLQAMAKVTNPIDEALFSKATTGPITNEIAIDKLAAKRVLLWTRRIGYAQARQVMDMAERDKQVIVTPTRGTVVIQTTAIGERVLVGGILRLGLIGELYQKLNQAEKVVTVVASFLVGTFAHSIYTWVLHTLSR